jgi:hypothetical protein
VEHGGCPRLRVQAEYFSFPEAPPEDVVPYNNPLRPSRNPASGMAPSVPSRVNEVSPLCGDFEGCPVKTFNGFRTADRRSSVNVAIAALRRSRKVGVSPIVEGEAVERGYRLSGGDERGRHP